MNLVDNYMAAMRLYAEFSGRMARGDYWLFILAVFLVSLAGAVLDALLGLGIFSPVLSVLHLLPAMAAGTRRLHDADRTGWWMFLLLLPGLGALILTIFFCLRGTQAANRYGPQPQSAAD